MRSLQEEVAFLKQRIAAALATQARLRRELMPGEIIHPRSALGLPPTQRYILACLLHRGPWARESLADILTLYREEGGESDDQVNSARHVDAAICRIRAAVRPYGLQIHTLYGRGFTIVPSQRRAFRELLEAEAAQLDAEDERRSQASRAAGAGAEQRA